MHVLLVPSWYPASETDVVGSFFREQAQFLHAAGVQVGVIAPRGLSVRKPLAWSQASGVEVIDDGGIATVRRTFVDWFGRVPGVGPRQWVSTGLELYARYVAAYGTPDLLHAHSLINGGILAQRIQSVHGVPFVVTEHSTAYSRKLVPTWRLALARKAAKRASARIAVSEQFRELLDEELSEGGAWECVPNAVSPVFLSGPTARMPTDREPFQFCNVGLMTPKKGQEALVEAFAHSFRGSPDVTLAIGGDGVLRRHLQARCVALRIANQVRFLGSLGRGQVADLMRESDAFVLSSEVETFGVVVAEALATGLPVVATRSGGPESIVRSGDGILVPVGDVTALAEAMSEIRRRRTEFSPQRLREACAARYSPNAIAARLIQIYRDALLSAENP